MQLTESHLACGEIVLAGHNQPPITMSTREIARLTGKRHDHVLRDARNMFEALDLAAPKFGSSYIDASGKQCPEYLLPQNECLTLVSGYSISLRHRIILRWSELEQQQNQKDSLPDFTDPASAAIAWAEQYKVRQQLEVKVAENRDKVAFADQVSGAEGDMTIGEAAKKLKIGRNAFFKWLRDMKFLYSHGREQNMPYQRYMRGNNQGCTEYFSVRQSTYKDREGIDQQASTTLMTVKGFIAISRKLADFRATAEPAR